MKVTRIVDAYGIIRHTTYNNPQHFGRTENIHHPQTLLVNFGTQLFMTSTVSTTFRHSGRSNILATSGHGCATEHSLWNPTQHDVLVYDFLYPFLIPIFPNFR